MFSGSVQDLWHLFARGKARPKPYNTEERVEETRIFPERDYGYCPVRTSCEEGKNCMTAAYSHFCTDF
jgi:hypothetical protein